MILVESKIKNDILHALYRAVGLNTPGQGIAFTMPVESVVGLTDFTKTQKDDDGKKDEPAAKTDAQDA